LKHWNHRDKFFKTLVVDGKTLCFEIESGSVGHEYWHDQTLLPRATVRAEITINNVLRNVN